MKEVKIKRDTNRDLFEAVLSRIKESGDYKKAETILDYELAPRHDQTTELTNYDFDYVAKVMWGGSEGIYINCYLDGEFDNTERSQCPAGTFKTLSTSLDAFKIMGELAGILTYHTRCYVDENIDRYEPERKGL